ncbi:MAG: bifunctional 2-C-methyl-D-erythritol 4-phosphate cytidylyltransferase/2-C-methyl-D-erythritol 2,4-cyclodiphosphate synthase, partial [Hyphomicrobiaceae bacterium]
IRIHTIQVVIHPDDRFLHDQAMGPLQHRCRAPALGGATRQASVLAGLEALKSANPTRVLIHDAARPFVSSVEIGRIIDALADGPAAISAVQVVDTLKRAAADGSSAGSIDRTGLWAAQTPQGFRFDVILDAHRKAAAAGRMDFTDDAAIAEWAGIKVALVQGSLRNIKLTTQADFDMAEAALTGREPKATAIDVRNGTGFDVHRFAEGDAVWLCGVRIPHTQRLEGHSDADVGLHALTDAILGALGDGDIGQHFPPSDPQWKGAASHKFLRDAVRRARERGATITNADVTLLCEAPKISAYRDAMRAALAEILDIAVERVGVKATTTEGLGFTGRREGIAAMASATLVFS